MKIRQEIPTPQLAGVLRAEAQAAGSHSQSCPHTELGRTRARQRTPPPHRHRLAFPRKCCLTTYDKIDAGKSAGSRASASCCTRAGPRALQAAGRAAGRVLSVRAGSAPAPRPRGAADSCATGPRSGARPAGTSPCPASVAGRVNVSLEPSCLRYFGYTTRSD